VSTLACDEPLSLSHVPPDQVVRVVGLSDEQFAVGLDPLPDGAPVVIRYRVPGAPLRQQEVVGDVLDQLESVALGLFPAWLPDAAVISERSDFDRRVVQQLARRLASGREHFGPFVAGMAEAAVRGCRPSRRFGPELRSRGLTRVIADSYGRDGVVLLLGSPEEPSSEDQQRRVAAACEWLVTHGDMGVWLTPGALPLVDRYPTWQLSVPRYLDALSVHAAVETRPPSTDFPPLVGRPHPASVAEQTLERCLARCDWATGRTWNQEYASHSLAPPIRVDLMWPDERCVVEIDGHDHRGSLKYAADRRRDNGLMLDGFAVLRFTNDEVSDDPQRVLAVIEALLIKRRLDEGNLL
jgi:very-short-patch-repair endonuclease